MARVPSGGGSMPEGRDRGGGGGTGGEGRQEGPRRMGVEGWQDWVWRSFCLLVRQLAENVGGGAFVVRGGGGVVVEEEVECGIRDVATVCGGPGENAAGRKDLGPYPGRLQGSHSGGEESMKNGKSEIPPPAEVSD